MTEAPEAPAVLSILHVTEGDVKITFNENDPEEVAKAAETIRDLLKRGYVLLVTVKGKTRRVKSFDPHYNSYIVKGCPDEKVPAQGTEATAVAPMGGG